MAGSTAADRHSEAERAYSEAHQVEVKELSNRSYKAVQAETRKEASHRWKRWDVSELEIVTRADLSLKEAALMLGRTYASVARMRTRLHRHQHRTQRAELYGAG
jgi:hypothetical protein